MPKRTLTTLGISFVVLLIAYVACIAATIFFATLRTELTSSLEHAESRVGALETKYYSAIAKLNATDVGLIGYVIPTDVAYVTRDGSVAVTRADR
jgi:archaellum component FlaF (FlaF/FlaG flagellin family)